MRYYIYSPDKYKNVPSFKEYRTSNNDLLIDLEQETFTTKQEITFKDLVLKMSEENKVIMQVLTKLLEKQSSGPTFHARIREPDTYHGDRGLDAATRWIRSSDYTATLLHDEADIWWRQQELMGDCGEWSVFKRRFLANFSPPNRLQLACDRLASLVQTSTVANYVSQFQAAWSSVPSMVDEKALDQFQRGLQPTGLC
ncbi:hypothetical protein INT45_007365, partial [Circinella minor]